MIGLSNTPIQGFHAMPIEGSVADAIRVALMMIEAALLGKIFFGLLDRRSYMHYLPWERRVAWLCVATFVVRNLYAQIVQYGSPLTWEGTPFTALALCLGWLALRHVRVPVYFDQPEPIPELVGVRRNGNSGNKGNAGDGSEARRPLAHS